MVFPHSEKIYVETLCYWDFPVLPIDLQSLVAGVLAGIRVGETWAIMAIPRACCMVKNLNCEARSSALECREAGRTARGFQLKVSKPGSLV